MVQQVRVPTPKTETHVNTWGPGERRRDLTPINCPLISACTHAHRINVILKFKKVKHCNTYEKYLAHDWGCISAVKWLAYPALCPSLVLQHQTNLRWSLRGRPLSGHSWEVSVKPEDIVTQNFGN